LKLNYECEKYYLQDLVPADDHTILFNHVNKIFVIQIKTYNKYKTKLRKDSIKYHDHIGPPDPNIEESHADSWNDDFVKMPFSEFNIDDKNKVFYLIENIYLRKIYNRQKLNYD